MDGDLDVLKRMYDRVNVRKIDGVLATPRGQRIDWPSGGPAGEIELSHASPAIRIAGTLPRHPRDQRGAVTRDA